MLGSEQIYPLFRCRSSRIGKSIAFGEGGRFLSEKGGRRGRRGEDCCGRTDMILNDQFGLVRCV